MSAKTETNVRRSDSQIFLHKRKILEKIIMNQVVIIVGQTGCGKSTQIPQYLLQSGISKDGIIACLHPRCIAAITLAERVAYETKTALGSLVGYRVRFDSRYSVGTRILYMTTGYMLRLLRNKPEIDKYSVIIIDEAHERSLQNDIMIGLMKMIMKTNWFVKLVIMSATLNVEEIAKYFPGSVTVKIKDVNERVEVIYRPMKDVKYIVEIKVVVKEILETSTKGHILVFLPSEEKVRKCKKLLKELKKLVVLSFYSAMDYEDKMMVFREFGRKRKVILATNVAETSLTIEGVDFVIDSGYVKRVHYDHENRVEKWITDKISMAEADQRKGRTGRTGRGKCYRLYENPLRNADGKPQALRSAYPNPEIKNLNLGDIILTLKSIDINEIDKFPFIVNPDPKIIESTEVHLKEHLLLTDNGTITKLGKDVACLPLDPIMGKVAVIGSTLSCRRDVLIIIALTTVLNIFKNPTGQESRASHRKFYSAHGDLFKLLNVYESAAKFGFSKQWCKENCINYSCLKYAIMIENQLHQLLPTQKKMDSDLSRSKENPIKKAFMAGFFNNIAYPVDGGYVTCCSKLIKIHDGSCLANYQDVVMGTTILQSATGKNLVLRNCVTLNEDMLKAFVPEKYKIKINTWKEIMKKITEKEKQADTIKLEDI